MIRVQHATKTYGSHLAVDDISFEVGKGEIVGFLGPNGAGKTTTMRMIAGYLMPTSGEIRVADHDVARQSREARSLVGYLPEIVPLYTDMTTRAYLEYAGRLHGLSRERTAARVEEVVLTCGLEEYVDVILRKLSKGYKQRVGLAQAIIHEPEVLILDEPTIGIDPIQVAQTRALIRSLGEKHTILLSSHILPEIRMICERVVILNRGRIVGQDRVERLSELLTSEKKVRLRVTGPVAEVTRCLEAVEGVLRVEYAEPFHVVEVPADSEPRARIAGAIVGAGFELLAMEDVEMSLEDIFLALTDDKAAQS